MLRPFKGSAEWAKPFYIRQTTLVSHGRVQNVGFSTFFFEDPSKRRIRPGPPLPPTPRVSAHLHRPKSLIFLVFFNVFSIFFDFVTILAHLGFQDAPESLQDASKARSRASKTPQEPPRCLQDTPAGGQKALFFFVFLKVFAFLGLLGAILV